jgi:hypothetical protein
MHYFESGDYFQGENLKSFDLATTALVHCFLFGDVTGGEPGFQVLSW